MVFLGPWLWSLHPCLIICFIGCHFQGIILPWKVLRSIYLTIHEELDRLFPSLLLQGSYYDYSFISIILFYFRREGSYITVAYAHFFLRIVLAKCRVNFKIVCLLIGNKSINCLKLLVHFSLIGYLFDFIKNIGTWNFMLTMNKTLWEKSINTHF